MSSEGKWLLGAQCADELFAYMTHYVGPNRAYKREIESWSLFCDVLFAIVSHHEFGPVEKGFFASVHERMCFEPSPDDPENSIVPRAIPAVGRMHSRAMRQT